MWSVSGCSHLKASMFNVQRPRSWGRVTHVRVCASVHVCASVTLTMATKRSCCGDTDMKETEPTLELNS